VVFVGAVVFILAYRVNDWLCCMRADQLPGVLGFSDAGYGI